MAEPYICILVLRKVRGIRRRKWQELSTGDIVVRKFDITHEGTRLSKEFAAFLPRTLRSTSKRIA